MRIAMLAAIATSVSLQGCTVIHTTEPLYDRTKESTFESRFAGTWVDQDMRWTIERGARTAR